MALTVINGVGNAQEKYAVLITGDYAAEGIPVEKQWGQGAVDSPMEEFWYDTYLMWEMLVYEKDYSDENVFILFANGNDYTDDDMWERYTTAYHGIDHITDYSATITNVEDVLSNLALGTGGFPHVTEDDFLFVWVFDHGGGNGNNSYFNLLNGEIMWDYDFAALTDQILSNKKVFWMQQCWSGGFADDLEADNTVFHSASQPMQNAQPADNWTVGGDPVDEFDFYWSGDPYYRHGEFNFHTYSATVGESPAFVNNYNGQPYTEADENSDNYISVLESYNWEDTHESRPEDPLYSDLGDIGANTSLHYPTLLFEDIGGYGESISHRGIIGISKDVHVTSGNQLNFIANADVYLLNEAKLIVDEGASLVLGDNVTIVAKNYNNQIVINGGLDVGDNVTFT